jgi:hypothetical protein
LPLSLRFPTTKHRITLLYTKSITVTSTLLSSHDLYPITVTMLYLSWIAGVTALLPLATAVCCTTNGVCGDGTSPTPCCAHGKCNIFCCNCDGGCRGRSLKRDLPLAQVERSDSIKASFTEADTEGAGNITVDRYLEYMGVTGDNAVWVKWFEE